MSFSHSNDESWGSLYKLHVWRWGITLDWGTHRFILRTNHHSRVDDEDDLYPATPSGSEQ